MIPVLGTGVQSEWSRRIRVSTPSGDVTWHLLDTHAGSSAQAIADVGLTVLCVHGNPTSSFMFRRLLATAPEHVRVIAVDQLGMGWSQRVGRRGLADRVDDLVRLTQALDLRGPVVTVAHDWGGPVSLGWVLRQQHIHADPMSAPDPRPDAGRHGHIDIVGVVLFNTAVHQPAGSSAPWLIRAARVPVIRGLVARRTRAFLRGTLALSPHLASDVRRGYLDPYPTATSRAAIGDFIADIPLAPRHRSWPALAGIAQGIGPALRQTPVLLLWGPGDPVFSDRYLHDLVERLPHADVQRYDGARHLVIEDAPRAVEDLWTWVRMRVLDRSSPTSHRAPGHPKDRDGQAQPPTVDLLAALRARASASPAGIALREAGTGDDRRPDRVVTWRDLDQQVHGWADALRRAGVHACDRVAILVPPGIDAVSIIYACWHLGAVVVIVDRGLGLRAMRRTLRGVGVHHAVGIRAGLLLAWSIGVRSRVAVRRRSTQSARTRDVRSVAPRSPDADASWSARRIAAIVFTSGSTGPAKGVRYTRGQIAGTCQTLQASYALTGDDVLVAAFAPWAILGPALGLASVIPAMDLLRPSTLSATALAQAVGRARGSVLWASPAALRTVVDTAAVLTDQDRAALAHLRLVLAAGAPVPTRLLAELAAVIPQAHVGTPYGMTEVLPVTAVWLPELLAAPRGPGVLVGRPVDGVEVAIEPFATAHRVRADDAPPSIGAGEILVRADHMREGYHHLWAVEQQASQPSGWHRTGDVGTFDATGRLWLGGRLAHVIWTSDGPVLPVDVEQRVESLEWVRAAAAVGIGPIGAQVVAVVIIEEGNTARRVGARVDLPRVQAVRAQANVPIAAVLRRATFPVDVRHQAKVDRAALAGWAERILAGAR